MVLVAYKPRSNIGILQTKLGHREGHEARRGGLETMPLDQYVEGGHGEREPGVKIRPAPAHDLKEPSQNNFSKSTLLLYDPWQESPVFCLGIPGSLGSMQISRGHRYTSFLKLYSLD